MVTRYHGTLKVMNVKDRRKGGYAKVFGKILDSTVWDLPAGTRLAWITLLVTCDQDGYVRTTTKSLARRAAITVEEAEAAIEQLSSPDPDSRCAEFEGRRIIPEPGGYMIVSHAEYRSYRSPENIRNAEKQQRYRESKSPESLEEPATGNALRYSVPEPVVVSNKKEHPKTLGQHLRPPPDFKPAPGDQKIAAERGLDFDSELANFLDHEFARTCLDWNPRFRVWLRRATPPRGGPPKPKPRMAKAGDR